MEKMTFEQAIKRLEEIVDLLKENNYVAKLFDSLTFDNKEIEDFYKKIFMVLNNYIDKRIGVYNA